MSELVDRYPHLERERVYRLSDAAQPPVSETWDHTPPSMENDFETAHRFMCTECGIVRRFPPWRDDEFKGHCSNHPINGQPKHGRQVIWERIEP